MINDPILELKRETEKKKKEKRRRRRIARKRKELENFLRREDMNSFARVYYFQALDKIINEFAIKHYTGDVDFKIEGNKIIIEIINKQFNRTNIKELIEEDKKNKGVYTLLTALTMVDDFVIKPNEKSGGVIITITKAIPLFY